MTTATYVVLLHGDETQWLARDAAALARLDASHRAFVESCARDGHEILHAHELERARTARVVRRGPGRPAAVTDGPFAESVEQLGGLYVVRTSDRDALVDLVAALLTEDAEVRPVVGSHQGTHRLPRPSLARETVTSS